MNLWLWIGLPMLFLLGILLNAIKDMKALEKRLPKYLDKVRNVKDDDEDDWPKKPPESKE
jgi:hypothetical protein